MVSDRPPVTDMERFEPAPSSALAAAGIDAPLVSRASELDLSRRQPPDVVLLDTAALSSIELDECLERCRQAEVPVIALVPARDLADFDEVMDVDDFIAAPARTAELVTRARRVLANRGTDEGRGLIRAGDLVINPTSYQVSLKGTHVELRFKEYELLVLLATNPGRAFSREALLNRIWGYHYYGGIRTVDVHIRRLRSKLQDAEQPLIETVWNVGYRFASSSSD